MTNQSRDIASPVPPPSDTATPIPDKSSDDAILKQKKTPKKKANSDTLDPALKSALDKLDGAFQRSLMRLRSMRGARGLRRLWEGNRHVYAGPWYLVIGKHGVGKTSALLNSSLTFPPSGRISIASDSSSAQNHAGHADWWLSDSIVLINAPERYVVQQVAAARDNAEWLGFLGLLRKYRRRTPINGALVMLDVGELLTQSESDRLAYADQLRARLHELRIELGIRFPVYVIVTKMDLLKGFTDYFHSLTAENRAQAWGFTLPYVKTGGKYTARTSPLENELQSELQTLSRRLDDGLQRQQRDELDHARRRALSALPQEFDSLTSLLTSILGAIFCDSSFDNTQTRHSLRGIYFTSAAQGEHRIPADQLTPLQRQLTAENDEKDKTNSATHDAHRANPEASPTSGNRGYFLSDMFNKVIIPEAHLARPNLRRVFRLRLLRWIGHASAVVIGFWLVTGLILSFGNNSAYLHAIADKTTDLMQRMNKLFALPDTERMSVVPDALTAAQELPLYRGLDIKAPSTGFAYGLYSAPPVAAAAHDNYAALGDRLLLPQIIKRMEATLATAVINKDAETAYDTLRVYLQLHDKAYFSAADVQGWVEKDWSSPDSVATFGGRASMAGHVKQLFSGERVVQATTPQNAALVQQARELLNGSPSTLRLYERAKAAMMQEAPRDFTLTRAVGPGASTVFLRISGAPLDKGIPGLFTYDGYHRLFDVRLSEFVAKAQADDAWVMGHRHAEQKPADVARSMREDDPVTQAIRRQYLEDYTRHWTTYLDDIDAVSGKDLKADMDVLHTLSAQDSPLARLARAAAQETTLSRPLDMQSDNRNLLDKATEALKKKSRGALGISPQERQEKELVDNHFTILREVVTGQPEIGQAKTVTLPALANVMALLNEYYTVLTVADTALATNSAPPARIDTAIKLEQASVQLPAPFKRVLTTLEDSGSKKISDGTSSIFRVQAQRQVDRINALMTSQVSDLCKRSIEGHYPFAASVNEVSIENFSRMFAAGGAADEFFQNQLASFVDTSSRPWKYKIPVPANLGGAIAVGMQDANLTGSAAHNELLKVLAQQGPNPDAFARIRTIREAFFREPGSKQVAWKVDVKAMDVAPTITTLLINLDGQVQRYSHGPVQALTVNWPGPRGGVMAELTASPRISAETSTIATQGPWALLRLLERGTQIGSSADGRTTMEFQFDTRKVVLEMNAGATSNPFTPDVLKGFSCPGSP
ncbi:type VI secretion system membrane subunit TssM [Collimonas antrihumi]|uniref:type VI secretion system membrane subunit TssM n=1 Tax=Collimonas antrihumi TaxID=1940615 RepID=UPI001B8CB44E|nr:type VI secretion system membrane subunit TssM [Collimonas antrihumi]